MAMEQSPPASNARIPPKAAPMPSIKWPQVDSPQEQSTGCLSVTKSPVVVRTVLRTASNKPPGVTRTVSSTGSIKQHDNTQLQEDIDAILPVPAAELLSPADVNVLREVGKVPVENRVWGTDDKTSEKFAADILIKIPEYARFDQRTLRIMCHAAQWRQFKRGQAMTVAGEEQDEFFIVITGTVAGRITVKKPQMNPEKGGEARDTPRVRHVPSDETLGEEIERLNSGQSVGMGALLTGWNTWRVGYTAQTKVEVLVVPRTKLESIETILKWSFDSRTLMDVLRDYQKLHPPLHAAQANAHSNPHSSLTQEHNRSRSEEWVTKISTAMRQIPSFRQLPQEAVHTLARSIEMQEFDSQQVVWEQSQGALNATAEITDGAEQDAASMLHVVLRGKVWVFKKDGSASSKNKDTKTVKDLWASPLQMYARFGHCQQTLVECDCMGEPTALTHEYSMIADKGTVLVRICNPKHLDALKDCVMVSQQGLVRQLMAMPNYQRTELDRMRLIATITQELSFFQHIGSVHVAKLLEQATLQKMHKGDILIKQGAEADCCYIIVNGFTCAYECTDLASEDKLCRLWSKWEAIRSKGEYEVLGTFVRRSGVGYCIGESEVVEKATFRISVVADDEVEVICIPASVYTSVMWDLCDGEPLDVDRIRAILAIPPQEREKDVVDELIEMFEDSDFLSQFPPDVQRQMSEAMSLFDCAEGHLIVRQNSDGDSLFLVISGSVALHKSNETSGASGVEPRAKTTSSQKESACLGPCKRVLGIGDSFGELAFVQGRAHPTASISRSKSTMIVLRRGGMQPHSIARMLSFVANPRSQSMDEVFAKDVSDRNENDILLLINYLEMNPFLKQMAYPIMVDAAHSILRHQVDCGKTLRANPDDEESEVLSETRVFIVNGGSMQVTPKIRGSSISVQWQDMPTVPGQRATFGEQLKLCKESSGHAREENILFSGQLYFGTTRPPESEAAGSKATTPVRLTAIIKSRPVAAFIAGIRRKVFAVNASGIITHTSVKGKDGGMLTEFGSVYEISSIERTSLPKFPYSIRIGIRGNYWIMAGVFRSDCDTFIKVLCDFNPYFDFTFRDPVWVEDQVQMQRDEVGWKNILLRIMADGEVMYSSSLEPQDNSEWLSIGNLHQCIYCHAHPTIEKPAAMQLILESKCKKLQTTWMFNAGTQEGCEAWLNRFCMKCPSEILNVRFDSIGEYGESVNTMDPVTTMLIRDFINRTVTAKRKHLKEAHQIVANAASKGKASTHPAGLGHLAPLSIDSSVFVAYGSAFRTNGKAFANDEGCLLFSMSAHDWGRIKRRQIEYDCEEAIQVLRTVSVLARASHKDLLHLAHHSYVTNIPVGEITPGSSLSNKHVHMIHDGVCKLRRPRQKENHSEKIKKHAIASRGAPGGPTLGHNLVKLECPTCFGGGVSGAIPAISDRIKLCKTCNGLGSVVQDEEDNDTDVGELRTGAVLSEAIPRADFLANYEVIGCSPLQLLSVKLELWMDLKYKWEKIGTAMPQADSVSNVTESLLNTSRAVRAAVKKGNVKQHRKYDLFVKKLSLEEKAKRLIEKTHSARMREIDHLLNVERAPPADILVSSRSKVAPAVLLCAPPNTIKNRFAGIVPPLKLEPILGDDMHGVFLTNLPVTERFLGPSKLKSAQVIPSKSGAQTTRFKETNSKVTIKLAPLSLPGTQANGDVSETWRATLRSRRERPEDMGYAPKVTLKYGNAFALDDRQKHIYKIMQEMLSESNYADFSSDASHMSQVQGPAKVPAANRERTVDIFEFYSALQKYKLLGAKVTDERVMGLKAVCKADAAKIFKKVTKNEQGNQESRMSMVKFHEAVQLVAKVLQVPLDGQPDGKAIRARTITARGPREIQNANTSTLTDDDKFKSHVLLKQEMQAEIDSVQLASHMALASIARNSF